MNKHTREKIVRILENMQPGDHTYIHCDCQPTHQKSIQISRRNSTGFAYCHRCHDSYHWKETYINQQHRRERGPAKKGRNVPDCSLVGISDYEEWPPVFQAWAGMLQQDEITQCGIEYVPKVGALKIPTMNGCTWRYMNPKRYMANYQRGDVFVAGKVENGVWVLVEDVLSAIVVARHTFSVSMMGTALGDVGKRLITHYRPSLVVVWTDNDNPQVRQSARKVARIVQGLGIRAHIVTEFPGKDPKEIEDKVIADYLTKLEMPDKIDA